MENVIQNPGLQHITEMILFNLDFEALNICKYLNKFFKKILEDPMFWLKKWSLRGLSKENQVDWAKAIQMTRNKNLESNVRFYIKRIIECEHFVDVPCFIDEASILKYLSADEKSFFTALSEKDEAKIQLSAITINNNPKLAEKLILTSLCLAANNGNVELIKVLAPLVKNPNDPGGTYTGKTPIYYAAMRGDVEIIKFLAPLSEDVNLADEYDLPPNARNYGKTPIDVAKEEGHHEIIEILKKYI